MKRIITGQFELVLNEDGQRVWRGGDRPVEIFEDLPQLVLLASDPSWPVGTVVVAYEPIPEGAEQDFDDTPSELKS